MNMKGPIAIFASIILLFFLACGGEEAPQTSGEMPKAEEQDLGDFYAFYQRFHNDSLFQIEHIIFPLKGVPREVDSITLALDNFYWQKDEWIMHKPFDFQMSEFERDIQPFSENLIQERIIHTKTGSMITRRFAKLSGGEWHLIYYADLNFVE
ncbi:MAG: DUF4348 domain-containing protein [Bacteroidetes bacterium]|nr:DUF4348 domain-containing protein [Bacteroidota bacterium]